MNKVGLVSLGCSKNLVDSEMMLGILREQGYILEDDPAQADVLIVNTCGFIDSAKQESIDTILEMAGYKETGRCRTLVVAGCLSQRYQQEILEEIPEIDVYKRQIRIRELKTQARGHRSRSISSLTHSRVTNPDLQVHLHTRGSQIQTCKFTYILADHRSRNGPHCSSISSLCS